VIFILKVDRIGVKEERPGRKKIQRKTVGIREKQPREKTCEISEQTNNIELHPCSTFTVIFFDTWLPKMNCKPFS
jgi:hypothetical protein